MAFFELICTASKLKKLKDNLVEEKNYAIKVHKKEKTRRRFGHLVVDLQVAIKKIIKKILNCYFFDKFCYKVRHDGSCENYLLKSIVGFISGFILTYIFFLFFVFQLSFKLTTATVFCSVLGCILTIGLAFSTRVRCIVLLTLPQFFSQRGRQALLAYAFILAISGPVRNTLNNTGILSESLACGQEQLKSAVKQIIDIIKKPFVAIKEAIKQVVKTVKEIIKKIKEILLTIKRIIMAIIKVIKAAFLFLAKIINICNKELGTPFERCTRVFENAILDCNAKLGPLFNWLCSLTYLVKSVCYLVKVFDYVCMLVDFISNSIIGVVIRKVKTFIRHIRTMFYVRIKFSHAFEFQTTTSKTLSEVAQEIIAEIRQRSSVLVGVFKFMTSASTIFFLFIIIRVIYYRYKFLTSERFDNRYITKYFRALDLRRAKLGKETILPLNKREAQVYVSMDSNKLGQEEKKAVSKAATTLATASIKLAILIAADYCLYWILDLIKYYGRFQSKVQAPNMPEAHISGNGFLADLLRSIVKAFQPAGILLEIDTVPCLPNPIPPNYDRYVQIATLILLCWFLTLAEPYGLRLRNAIMSYYHPTRAKQRSIWLYNHIMRSRNSFLKFARRQLRRKVFGEKGIEKITFKEYLTANFMICRYCLGDDAQTACLLCGEVFRESDDKKPIKCQTPGCPGVYCEQCYADLQNLCTVCLSPIEYGDLSDISQEKDSSEEEPRKLTKKDDQSKQKKCWCCRICKRYFCKGREEESGVEDYTPKPKKRSFFKRKPDSKKSEYENNLLQSTDNEEEKKGLIDESSEEEPRKLTNKDDQSKRKKCWCCRICKRYFYKGKEEECSVEEFDVEDYTPKPKRESSFKRETYSKMSEDEISLFQSTDNEEERKDEPTVIVNKNKKTRDSDYYTSDNSTDYSYSYQYEKSQYTQPIPRETSFKDVEKQEIQDYASMESFREDTTYTVLTNADKKEATYADTKEAAHADKKETTHADQKEVTPANKKEATHAYTKITTHTYKKVATHADKKEATQAYKKEATHADKKEATPADKTEATPADKTEATHADKKEATHAYKKVATHAYKKVATDADKKEATDADKKEAVHADKKDEIHADKKEAAHAYKKEATPADKTDKKEATHAYKKVATHAYKKVATDADKIEEIHADKKEATHEDKKEEMHADKKVATHAYKKVATDADKKEEIHADKKEATHADKKEEIHADKKEATHENKKEVTDSPAIKTVGTTISGITLTESKKDLMTIIGVPATSKPSAKKKQKRKKEEETPLLDTSSSYSDTDDDLLMQTHKKLNIRLLKSTTMKTTDHLDLHSLTSSNESNGDSYESNSSIDSEIRRGFELLKINIQHKDRSHLSEPYIYPKYTDSIFSNVTYYEISESPRSNASSKSLTSSTVISSLKYGLADSSDKGSSPREKPIEIKPSLSTELAVFDFTPSDSTINYTFENKQREKVKQYYKAVKDVPIITVKEKRKPGKFMRCLRKIFPKRKKNLDVLPLYSTESKSTIELQSYEESPSNWNILSSSTYIEPDNLTYTKACVLTEEERQGRERGGECSPTQNSYRIVKANKIKESSNFPEYSETGNLLKIFSNYPSTENQTTSISRNLRSEYLVTIEDLTPTRDSDIPMNAIEAHRSIYGNKELPIRELPEKDATQVILKADSESNSANSHATPSPVDDVQESTSSNLSESLCKSILGGPCPPTKVRKSIDNAPDTPREIDRKLRQVRLSGISETDVSEINTSKSEPRQNKFKSLKSNENTRPQTQENQGYCKSRSVNKLDTKKSGLSQRGRSCISNTQKNRPKSQSPESCCSRKTQVLQTCPTPILKFQCITDETKIMDSPRYNTDRDTPSDTDSLCVCGTDRYPVKERGMALEPRQKQFFTSDKMQQTSDNDICCSLPRSYDTVTDTASNRAVASTVSESTRPQPTFIESNDAVAQVSSTTYCACQYSDRPSTDKPSTFNCCKCTPPPPPRYEDYVNLQDKNCRPPKKLPAKYVACTDKYIRDEPSDYITRPARNNSNSTRRDPRETPIESGYSLRESQYNEFRRDPVSSFTTECTRRCRLPDDDVSRHRNKSSSIIICACNGGCRRCQRKLNPHTYHKYHSPDYASSSSVDTDEESDDEDYLSDSHPTCYELPYQNNEEYLELVQELEETLQSRNRNRVRRAMQEFEHRSKYNKPLEKPIIDYDETSESEQPIIQKISQLTSDKNRCCGGDKCTCRRIRSNRPKYKEKPHPKSTECPYVPRYRHRSPTESMTTHWQMDTKSGEWYKVSVNTQSRKNNRGAKTPSPHRGYCPYDCNCCSSKNYDFR